MISINSYTGILYDNIFVCTSHYFTLRLNGEITRDVYIRKHDKTKEKHIGTYKSIIENPFFEIDLYKSGEICRNFDCSGNELTSLEGSPKTVGRDFFCSGNELTSLEGSPKTVGRDFYCYGNKKKFTEKEVRKVCNVKGMV